MVQRMGKGRGECREEPGDREEGQGENGGREEKGACSKHGARIEKKIGKEEEGKGEERWK